MSGMVDCRYCHRNVERDLTVVARLDTTSSVMTLVRAGLGAALVSEASVPPDELLAMLPLDIPFPPRVIGVAWQRARSAEPHLRHFVDVAYRRRAEA